MTGAPREFDVVVSGGGMVGASLAWALAGLPLRVALVEAVPFASAAQPSFDERTVALSRSSRKILEGLGVWPDVAAAAYPIHRIHVSERGRFGTALIDADEQGVDALGCVLANRVLGAALWKRLESASNVTLFCPASVSRPEPLADGVTLALDDGTATGLIRARLLVIAEGAGSKLRGAVGIDATERSYGQTAIVGNVGVTLSSVEGSVDGPFDGPVPFTAYERFTPQGPLALLPSAADRFVFVMARAPADADNALELDDARFLALLQDAFGQRLGRLTRLGQRSAYPLYLVKAERTTAPRAVLIGNAAHGLHPVAGQGFNLGLRDVATLAEVLADALRGGERDIGSPAVLERYAGWRRRDQRSVLAFTDGLIRLFDVPFGTAGAARGIGLALFDVLPGAKRALARRTMGLGGTLTRLARGLPL